MRAVLDPNVLISGLLSPKGAPARVLAAWASGDFELIASPLLLAELERALAYPKLHRRIPASDALAAIDLLRKQATIASDPEEPPPTRSSDPNDDYLIAEAANERAVLVSGDKHLLALADSLPIMPPAAFLDLLGESG